MTVDLNKATQHMYDLRSWGVTYSMDYSRTGTDGTADCSGALYASLRIGGMPKAAYVLNTESLHDWLLNNGFKLFAESSNFAAQKGDVFIWGKRGQCGGAYAHTGIFVDSQSIIHCNYAHNGVSVNPYGTMWASDGYPYFYIYRCNATTVIKDPSIISIYYVPGYGVNAINGDGRAIPNSNLKLKTGTSWHASGVYYLNGYAAYALGRDLPGWYVYQGYTNQVTAITINYEPWYGVNAVDSHGKTLKGTNRKFKTGMSWKLCGYGIYKIGGKLFYKVSSTEFISTFYTQGGGYVPEKI